MEIKRGRGILISGQNWNHRLETTINWPFGINVSDYVKNVFITELVLSYFSDYHRDKKDAFMAPTCV